MSLSGSLISPPGIKILFDVSLPKVRAAPKLLVITVKSRLLKRAFETSKGVDPIDMKIVDPSGICAAVTSAIACFPFKFVLARNSKGVLSRLLATLIRP